MFQKHNKLVLFSICLVLTICAAKINDFYVDEESISSEEVPLPFTKEDCTKSVQSRNCRARIHVFTWNDEKQKCVPAIYGGCRATPNMFRSLKDCKRKAEPVCKNRTFTRKDCYNKPYSGLDRGCRASFLVMFTWDYWRQECVPRYHVGCHDSPNLFPSFRECESIAEPLCKGYWY